jgi:hypothetical protein
MGKPLVLARDVLRTRTRTFADLTRIVAENIFCVSQRVVCV